MKLLHDILVRRAARPGEHVLGTVVDVRGSSYRRPGARVLIAADGERVGLISGGCLEKDVVRHAFAWTADGPEVALYDTRGDQLHPGGAYGSGCDGIVHLLLERLGGDRIDPLEEIDAVWESRQTAALATVYRAEDAALVGLRYSSRTDRHDDLPDDVVAKLRTACADASGWRHPKSVTLAAEGGTITALVEPLRPPPRLLIFGAGDDARPVASIAAELGWRVEVIDRWPALATRDRFASAATVRCQTFHDIDGEVELTGDSLAIVMTHNLEDDAALVPWLLASDVAWVGLLGPRRRTARVLQKMAEAGTMPSIEAVERLQTPVGLDLGGDAPEQVALSIVSAAVAALHGRTGGALQESGGPIHPEHEHVTWESE